MNYHSQPSSITFVDGRTFAVGDRVKFRSGRRCPTGVVFSIDFTMGRLRIEPDNLEAVCVSERWPLRKGAWFVKPRDHGVPGSEIIRKVG